MKSFHDKLRSGMIAGINKGWIGFVWMIRILLPISFFTMMLDHSGWINKISFLLEPVMNLLNLPAVAVLPLIAGMLTGIYGGIASMIMLPLSTNQMTLIAVFLLISHNLIQEGIIQGKSGMNPLKATLFRLAASVVTVSVVAQFLGPDSAMPVSKGVLASGTEPFTMVLKDWCMGTAYLSVKIFMIIMGLMMLLETMKSFNLIIHIVRAMNPLLKVIGLDQKVGMMWLAAGIFGIAYGAAVILEEAAQGDFTDEELTKLHLSIGINHSMAEDPALFLPLGISPFWLWIPRVITAILAVHLLSLWYWMKNRKAAGLLQES